ncbi:MAG: hypothetical protein ABFS28_03440 [Bacteroidota bacterium]
MKKKILLLFICIPQAVFLMAQEADFAGNIGNLNMDDGLTFDNRYSGVKGTPFIFKDYQNALIFSSNEHPIEAEYLNFDRYSRELCYKSSPGENAIQLNKYLIDSFYVFSAEDILSFARLSLEKGSDYVYMECLYRGESSLYYDYDKAFNSADYVDPYSADRRYDEFVDLPAFYIQFNQKGELHAIKKNKKQLSSLFGTSSKQILQYVKTEKTSLKSRTDLILLMKYYDSIKK